MKPALTLGRPTSPAPGILGSPQGGPASPREPKPLSVSQLNSLAKAALEGAMPQVWVQGEISNFAQPSSGHWYFSLKDAKAQVRCALFRSRSLLQQTASGRYVPKDGDQVLVQAAVSLYEGRGDYQLIVNQLLPAGQGLLQQQFDALKTRLQAEGVFEASRKKPLPAFPSAIGIISSPTGAAVRDIIAVLQKRYPQAHLILYPALVQGATAPESLCRALQLAIDRQEVDLIIIGRGGGSLEDLWAFNDETLVRALAACPLPTISAVGHEIDVTLCDFAADCRAPTPSAAAEMASPDAKALSLRVASVQRQLIARMQQRLQLSQRQWQLTHKRLQSPKAALSRYRQQLDYAELRLKSAWREQLQQSTQRLSHLQSRLDTHKPATQIALLRLRSDHLHKRLTQALRKQLDRHGYQIAAQAARLQTLSPLNTLQRGYAVVKNVEGRLITQAADAGAKGAILQLRWQDGERSVEVVE